MEYASSLGIRASRSKYIAIHDDDDSWHPEFLAKMVSHLATSPCFVKGAVSRCMRVDEVIVGSLRVDIQSISPYNDWIETIDLAEMLAGNVFAPIQFLFEREAHDQIGGFNPLYPVLGDWDFNLRFLAKFEIDFVNNAVAYYHHRPASGGAYDNSLYGAVDRHRLWESRLRNRIIRGDYGEIGVLNGSPLMASSRWFRDLRAIMHGSSYERAKETGNLQASIDRMRNVVSQIRAQVFDQQTSAKLNMLTGGRVEVIDIVELSADYSFVQVAVSGLPGAATAEAIA